MKYNPKIEVFKTDVKSECAALDIVNIFLEKFPNLIVNFDLEDCDNILRIECTQDNLKLEEIEHFLYQLKIKAEVLPD